MVNFGPKPWTNMDFSFGKISVFRFFSSSCFIAQKGVFSLQNIIKYIFLAQIAYKKRRWKNGLFWTKTMTNPLGKISLFRLFQLLVFIVYKGVSSLQNTIKHIFLAQIVQKKEDRKMANFGPKPNPFGQISIFRLFQLFFLQPRKASFCSRIS